MANDKKPRKPRRDFKAEHDRLTMHCRLSVAILNGLIDEKPSEDLIEVANQNLLKGQVIALQNVLRELGEKQTAGEV